MKYELKDFRGWLRDKRQTDKQTLKELQKNIARYEKQLEDLAI